MKLDYYHLLLENEIQNIKKVNYGKERTYKRHIQSNTNVNYNEVLLISGLKRNKHTESDPPEKDNIIGSLNVMRLFSFTKDKNFFSIIYSNVPNKFFCIF